MAIATIRELQAANALHTAAGLGAVKLAQLIDQATIVQGSSVAAWRKEHSAAMREAREQAAQKMDDP